MLALDHATGALAFRPLYIFVHREPAIHGVFVNIECAPLGGANVTRRLQLSARHYLPVCAGGDAAACGTPRLGGLLDSLRSSAAGWHHLYGGDVQPGMLVLAADHEGQLGPARVLCVWQTVERGLFNPLVEVGTSVPGAGPWRLGWPAGRAAALPTVPFLPAGTGLSATSLLPGQVPV